MELLKIIIFEYLLGYCLQGFTFVLGVFAFNRQKIVLKIYIVTSLLVIIISYLVRLLPISFGVHTIINMLFLMLICIIVLKMPAYSTIRSAMLIIVLLLICEMADIAIMSQILGKVKFESLMLIPLEKAIIGSPGAAFFTILITLTYFILNNPKKKNGENIGNISV